MADETPIPETPDDPTAKGRCFWIDIKQKRGKEGLVHEAKIQFPFHSTDASALMEMLSAGFTEYRFVATSRALPLAAGKPGPAAEIEGQTSLFDADQQAQDKRNAAAFDLHMGRRVFTAQDQPKAEFYSLMLLTLPTGHDQDAAYYSLLKKLNKALRDVSGLKAADVKAGLDHLPWTVLEKAAAKTAAEAQLKLESFGCTLKTVPWGATDADPNAAKCGQCGSIATHGIADQDACDAHALPGYSVADKRWNLEDAATATEGQSDVLSGKRFDVTITGLPDGDPESPEYLKAMKAIKAEIGKLAKMKAKEVTANLASLPWTFLAGVDIDTVSGARFRLEALGCKTEQVNLSEGEPEAGQEDPATAADADTEGASAETPPDEPAPTEEPDGEAPASARPDWHVLDGGDQDELPPAAEG